MARRKGRSLTRADVINAAIECLDEDGQKAFGVNRVARQLSIKPPSIYNHVQGNDDLHRAVALEGWRHLLDLYGPDPEGQPPLERLKEVCRIFRRFARQRPAYFAVTAATFLNPTDADVAEVFGQHMELVRRNLTPVGVAEESLGPAVVALRASLQGFSTMEANGQVEGGAEGDAAFEWMLDTIMGAYQMGPR